MGLGFGAPVRNLGVSTHLELMLELGLEVGFGVGLELRLGSKYILHSNLTLLTLGFSGHNLSFFRP